MADEAHPITASASGVEPMWWGREIFKSPDAADGVCPEVIDITGRARTLIFGPYVTLPPGLWRATVHLKICEDAARRPFELHFGGIEHYAQAMLPRGQAGEHAVRLDHAWHETGLWEVRLWLRKAAFHGYVALAGVRVERLGDAPG